MDSYSHHHHHHHHMFERRAIPKSRAPPVKWVKEWVPQDLVANGGKCMILKWVNEATFKAMKEKKEPDVSETEPEQTSEVLFLCNYEGCGKTFIDATLLKKHSHIHGERQYICHYENCGKKFLDSSKLKRHFLIHTGERDFVCPHAGCGKAFSLDFNLRSHMKTHSQENYHICPHPECGKRYAHEYKLRNHVLSQHEKNLSDLPKYAIPMPEPKQVKTPKASAVTYTSRSPDRPYVCPYDGCEKAYIHEYKLNLHLRREHPAHFKDDTPKTGQSTAANGAEETSDQDVYLSKRVKSEKTKKQSSRSKPSQNLPPAKIARKGSNSNPSPASTKMSKKAWLRKEVYGDNDDSEETEEEEEREETWRYRPAEEDDEETEYED